MKKILIILFFVFISISMQRNTSNGIKIYPNPMHDHFTASVEEGALPPVIRMYDISGKIVLMKNIGKYLSIVEISFNLKPGTYIVAFDDN